MHSAGCFAWTHGVPATSGCFRGVRGEGAASNAELMVDNSPRCAGPPPALHGDRHSHPVARRELACFASVGRAPPLAQSPLTSRPNAAGHNICRSAPRTMRGGDCKVNELARLASRHHAAIHGRTSAPALRCRLWQRRGLGILFAAPRSHGGARLPFTRARQVT